MERAMIREIPGRTFLRRAAVVTLTGATRMAAGAATTASRSSGMASVPTCVRIGTSDPPGGVDAQPTVHNIARANSALHRPAVHLSRHTCSPPQSVV